MTSPARFLSNGGYNIDAATSDDIPQIAELLEFLYDGEAEMNQEVLATDRSRIMRSDIERYFSQYDHMYLVIKWREDIVGFLHVMDREDSDYSIPVHIGWICELYVEEGFRNGGAGTLAIEAAEMWCKERGLTQVELSCNVLNVMAREWYEKRGFHTTYQVMKKVLHG